MSEKDDFLTRLLNQRDTTHRGMSQNAPVVNVSCQQNPPNPTPPQQTVTHSEPKHLASPHLTGKLADHLALQTPRSLEGTSHTFSSPETQWTAEDIHTRSAVTSALILASHIVRFASTSLSATHLNKARDALLRGFNAEDAVYLEVEAYELLQWFASAIDKAWLPKTASNPIETIAETSEDALIQIISNAIQYKHDLDMKYYTGSSGKFSKRRITPIEITAEKFLIAFCHLRQEERVFRLSRIVTLCPADNAPEEAPKLCYPNLTDTALPPLPDTPSTELKLPAPKPSSTPETSNRKNSAPHPTTTSPKPKGSTAKPKSKTTSKSSDIHPPKSSHKKSSVSSRPKPAPTLFDIPIEPQAPEKKKKSKHKPAQQILPGFDDK